MEKIQNEAQQLKKKKKKKRVSQRVRTLKGLRELASQVLICHQPSHSDLTLAYLSVPLLIASTSLCPSVLILPRAEMNYHSCAHLAYLFLSSS